MNISEDELVGGVNEENRLNDNNSRDESMIDSNTMPDLNSSSSFDVLEKIKRIINFILKNYAKIMGIVFFSIFLFGFVEIIQNNNPVVFYLEKGAECLENYFNSIDKIFINLKSSSSQNSVRTLNDAFFGEDITEKNIDDQEINEPFSEKNNITKKNEIPNFDEIIDFKYHKLYEFTKNITNFSFKGKWQFLKTDTDAFTNNEGDAELQIIKNFSYTINKNFISNLEAIKSLYVYLNLKDGQYRDNIIVTNFTLTFPVNFSDYFDTKNTNSEIETINNNIILTNSNISLSYYQQKILDNPVEYNCDQATIILEFIRDPKISMIDFGEMTYIEYSKLNIQIRDISCNFEVDLTLEIDNEDDFSDRVWNYSLITTFISIMEICFILKLINEVAENNQVGKNLCLITISINIIWNAFMCTVHFYLSMINEDTSYEYGTPNFFLFVSLLLMKYFFTNFTTSLIFFSTTWIFQIIHSTINGTKPPFSMKYVFVISIGKLFTPVGILAVQKYISPKFLLPKFLKKQPYNFYKELSEEDIVKYKLNVIYSFIIHKTECIICLELLLKPIEEILNQSNTLNIQSNKKRTVYLSLNKIINKIRVWFESLKYAHNKKSFMITPCNHAFHTPCFEKWIEMKNECPYCRRAIPPLE